MRTALLTSALLGLTGHFAGGAEPAKTESLIAQLASGSFAEREAATKSLRELGTVALPGLKKTLAESANPEVQDRVTSLLAKIQSEADSAQLTAGKPISLDFKDRPLNAAVSELRVKLGIPLVLHAGVKDPARSITVKSDELQPWQAFDKFCAAVGLMEQLKPDAKPEKVVRTGRRPARNIEIYDGAIPGSQLLGRPGDVTVTLVDGHASAPTDSRGGLRVRALPLNYPGAGIDRNLGEMTLQFDVAPVQGLNWVSTTEVRIGKASTVGGRDLQTVWKPDRLPQMNPYLSDDLIIESSISLDVPLLTIRTNPRVLPVTFKVDAGDLKALAKLEGLISGEIAQPNQPVLEIADLGAAVGRTFAGPAGSTLTVVSMATHEKTKVTTLVLRASSPSPWNVRRQALRLGEAALSFQSFSRFRYFDSDGKAVSQPSMPSTVSTNSGSDETYEATLRFGSGKPVKLLLTGTKFVPVTVPFKLKDVPLE